MATVTFPSKLVAEAPLLVFNFLNVMPASTSILNATVTVSMFTGTDGGGMASMVDSDAVTISGTSVVVPVTAGTAGCIYLITATAQLSNGGIYQQVGKLAVLDGDPFEPIIPDEITLWAVITTNGYSGVRFNANVSYNSELEGATEVIATGYYEWYEYTLPPGNDPEDVNLNNYLPLIEYAAPITLSHVVDPEDSIDQWRAGSEANFGPGGTQAIMVLEVDGVVRYAAATNGVAS